jgi:hypothetical protein
MRGQSGYRSAPDGPGIDNLHVRAAGASQVAARLSLKRLTETNGRTARALERVANFAQHCDKFANVNAVRIYHSLGYRIGQHIQEFRFELTPVHGISLLVARQRILRSMLRAAPRTERSFEFLTEFLKLFGVDIAHGPEVKPLLGPASDIESLNGFDLCSTILRPSAGCDE